MPTPPRRHTRNATVAVAATTLMLLAGCTGGSAPVETPTQSSAPTSAPTPTPEPSPTEATELEVQQENTEAAKERYLEYHAEAQEALTGGGGFEAFEELRPYLGSDETITWWESITEQFEEKGLKQVGEREVISITAIDYAGDPLDDESTQEVTLEVCLDSSDVTAVREDGSSAVGAESPDLLIDDVVMRRFQNGSWTVMVDETRTPWEEC